MKKLLLLLILSFFSAQSFAGSCPDGSEPVKSVSADGSYFVYNCGNSSNDGGAKTTTNDFDDSYSFTISRFNENEGSRQIGNGFIEINNGIMTVAKEGRTLDTGSIDLYDSFAGQIDKDGNISAVFTVNALVGAGSPESIDFKGAIDALQIKGTFDDYFDVHLKLKRGSYEGSPEAIFDEIKKSMDDDGILEFNGFSPLNAPHAINPVSVSDFSKIGKTSLRFESNDGECGQEPRWNDCPNDRERTEINYESEFWKTEKWYRFYLYLPKDYNSVAPAKMSLIQWKRLEPSKVLVQFQHMHAGLIFNRNGETFPDSYIVLKPNEDLLGNWTEIVFNTNWHPDPKKGFMKVWIDGKLKGDFKGRANINSIEGRELSLRYGLYSSYMSYYKNTFKTKKMPQRIAFYDGVKVENTCQKLLDINTCNNLISQNIIEYKLFIHDSNDKELHGRSICRITPANFEANERAALLGVEYNQGVNQCTFVKPTQLFTTIETSDAFDGSYSFTLSRFNPSEGSMKLGSGKLEISDGKISVAKKSRSLKTSSTTYYDTFEGQIDKEGNISAVFNVNALNGEGIPQPVVFTGTIDALQIKGKFDDSFEMIIKLRKKE
jgi:hypothetical protein